MQNEKNSRIFGFFRIEKKTAGHPGPESVFLLCNVHTERPPQVYRDMSKFVPVIIKKRYIDEQNGFVTHSVCHPVCMKDQRCRRSTLRSW